MCFNVLLLWLVYAQGHAMCWGTEAVTQCPEIPESSCTVITDLSELVEKNVVDKTQLICGLMENSLGHLIFGNLAR